jgi:hypothetical protein
MILKVPPQCGHFSMSISKTRLSNLAQLMHPRWKGEAKSMCVGHARIPTIVVPTIGIAHRSQRIV